MEKICRSCMNKDLTIKMKKIFETVTEADGPTIRIADMLTNCVSIEVAENDGLPDHLCEVCVTKLKSAYDFKKQCEKSDTLFRNCALIENIKQEALDISVKSESEEDINCPNLNSSIDGILVRENKKCNKMKERFKEHTNDEKAFENDSIEDVEQEINYKDDDELSNDDDDDNDGDGLFEIVHEGESVMRNEELEIACSNKRKELCTSGEPLTKHRCIDKDKTGTYLCPICSKECADSLALRKHLAVHKSILTYKCDECNVDFDSQESLSIHFCDGKNKKIHVCEVCNKSYMRRNYLKRHMLTHKDVFLFECDECDKRFASDEFLEKHKAKEHTKGQKKSYNCTVCNEEFNTEKMLIQHFSVHIKDTELDNLECCICEDIFNSCDELSNHLQLHMERPHVCTICGKTFTHLSHLQQHKTTHEKGKSEAKTLLCTYCGKKFNHPSNWKVHIRRHMGEFPFKCNHCDKGFPRSYDLKCHERSHSGERPFLCPVCGKSFIKKSKLTRHERVHNGDRPYVCDICGNGFAQSNDLRSHKRRHESSSHACNGCSARFISFSQLKKHCRETGHQEEVIIIN